MNNVIIQDDMLKESKLWRPPIILFFILVALLPLGLIGNDSEITAFILGELFFILIGCYCLFGYLYAYKYKVVVTKEKILLKTLFKDTEIKFKDIETYSCKRYKKSQFYQFCVFYQGKKTVINTRFKDEFEKLLKGKKTSDSNNSLVAEKETQEDSSACSLHKEQTIHKQKFEVWGDILFWLTLTSPMISFALTGVIGEVHIFSIGGIIRYSWIMLLFIPVGILSVLIGIHLKKSNQSYKKNIIIAFICVPLLMIFGSYRFIFNTFSYDADKVTTIEHEIKLELPKQIKIATYEMTMNELDFYNISYLKIVNGESKETFEHELEVNDLWQKELSSKIKSLLPFDIQYEVDAFDYFVFYNVTNDEYNIYPLDGEYESIFIAYDHELQRLMILDDYKINLN